MKIIAVDNDSASLGQLESCLKSVYRTSEVIALNNPLLALQYCAKHPCQVGLIYSALIMRPLDGLELLDVIHKSYPQIGLEFITQTASADVAALLRNRGCSNHLIRPVTCEKLWALARETQTSCCACYDEEIDQGKCTDCIFCWCERCQILSDTASNSQV